MSIIGDIGGIPLFSTTQEALTWAIRNGLSGYHAHQVHESVDGEQAKRIALKAPHQVAYMGGINHQEVRTLRSNYIGKASNTNVPIPPSSQVTTTPRPSITPAPSPRPSPRSSPSGGSSGSSSGGY